MRNIAPVISALLLLILLGCGEPDSGTLPRFSLDRRPLPEGQLFDYAGRFTDIEESARTFLSTLKNIYGIEGCILTLPQQPDGTTIRSLGADLLSSWDIGRQSGGRGLLLLFVDSSREVKLEVAYELEDVFTDAFTGFIEDRQLGPNYKNGDLAVGMLAVFEEIEQRAILKKSGEYSRDTVDTLDSELLSGGAGASRDLSVHDQRTPDTETGVSIPTLSEGAATPESAWQIMLGKWAGANRYPDVDIYTEATKAAMGDQNGPAQERVASQARLLLDVPFFVKQDDDRALIHFNRKQGWEYAPYLFVRTDSGWKFDIVAQRQFVVFENKGSWRLERGDHAYNALFGGFRSGLRKDLPVAADLVYRIEEDRRTAARIATLEREAATGPDDFDTALELGRLGAMTARRPGHVFPHLNRAARLVPAAPAPHKYLAVYHVMSSFQYASALKEIERYNRKGNSVFGLNVQGFVHHKLREYDRAAECFEKSLELRPTLYGYCKLARAEAMLYSQSSRLSPLRAGHRQRAAEAYAAAAGLSPDSWRVSMLARWLRHREVLVD